MINLKVVRQAAEMSQADLAERMGMSRHGQRTVSQIEAREDWLLSSLVQYFKAAGATAKLVVVVNGEQIEFDLG